MTELTEPSELEKARAIKMRNWQEALAALDSGDIEFAFDELKDMMFRELLPALGDAVANDDKELVRVLRSVSARSLALMKQQCKQLKARGRALDLAIRARRVGS